MMKQFPYVAYFHALEKKAIEEQTAYPELYGFIDNTMAEIVRTTHDTPIAKLTSVFHNKMLIELLDTQPSDLDLWKTLLFYKKIAPYRETMMGIDEYEKTSEYDPDSHMRITPIFKKLLTQRESIQAGKPYTLDQMIQTYLVQLDEKKIPGINQTMKPGFHVASTFGLVYGCFIQNQNWQWLLDAIHLWYDTDSQGAIIGNMIWALHGPFYEQKYIDGLHDKKDLQESLDAFTKVIVHKEVEV